MKHKLSGYAIKGDGTKETADSIRKVFEADGWKHTSYSLKVKDLLYYPRGNGRIKYSDELPKRTQLIPLTEAEALVFGELKVGMKVVFTDEILREAFSEHKGRIFEIVHCSKSIMKVETDGFTIVTHREYFRRATITDFLRTLPSDIAERALRQVAENVTNKYPSSLEDALYSFASWGDETEESFDFWSEVRKANYDRARAILAEKDRVGKWWKYDKAIVRITSKVGNKLYGYGCDQSGEWIDQTDESERHLTSESLSGKNLTPAPEKSKYKVGDYVASGDENIGRIDEFDGVYFNGVWFMMNTEYPMKCKEKDILRHATPEEIASVTDKPEPQPSEFPRVMWVWDTVARNAEVKEIVKNDGWKALPWWDVDGKCYMYASDTHPVTGEPAVKKDVVEQIREVVENDFTTDFYKVNEIKEILGDE